MPFGFSPCFIFSWDECWVLPWDLVIDDDED